MEEERIEFHYRNHAENGPTLWTKSAFKVASG